MVGPNRAHGAHEPSHAEILAVLIFWPLGFGLGGRLGATLMLPWALVTLTLQTLFSRWWLACHRFGPMESLWRRLTYPASGDVQTAKLGAK